MVDSPNGKGAIGMDDKDHQDDKVDSIAALTDEQILTLWDETAASGRQREITWLAALCARGQQKIAPTSRQAIHHNRHSEGPLGC